uniref:Uncharacterized protein n=1 Tax=Cyclophora tenuis TaxID=216820 RepID=A0A6U1RTP9_CYCTE|mmetsp:Transcript_3757/g.6421  ORF Transcript_3757/g.6421 Transcript_3757/m.6421 type:complete len:124 (+) Transcript_3757:74-445(+)
MSIISKNFDMPPCGCCQDVGLCCYVCWCPCLAYNEAANNIDSPNGIGYCLITFPLEFGCCALTILGDEVARKEGIQMGLLTSGLCAFVDCCVCYSCRVVNQSRIHKQQQQYSGVIPSAPMERK